MVWPDVKTTASLPEESLVRASRIVMPPPTMSYSEVADRSQMSSQGAIPFREKETSNPSIASKAVNRSASYPRCVLNPSESGSGSALKLTGSK